MPNTRDNVARRFVVLTHDHPFPHWDLLIESGDVCRTWRLLRDPATTPVPVEAIGDHRLYYLTYEGDVSGGRGTVTRWDAGTLQIVDESAGHLVVRFQGAALRGDYEITDAELRPFGSTRHPT